MQHENNTTEIFLYGLTGKMGHEITSLANEYNSFRVVGGSSLTSPSKLLSCSVALDFSTPSSLASHLKETTSKEIPILVGTTGLTSEDFHLIREASQKIPILQTSNTSIGITVLTQLIQQAAQLLDEEYDIEIFETHHRQKIDSPSGTALSLGRSAAQGRSLPSASTPSDFNRVGLRKKGTIGYAVHRGGGVTGDHTVRFIGDEEIVELSHRSLSRRLFARGALQAAKWLSQQPVGLYSMNDFLKKK